MDWLPTTHGMLHFVRQTLPLIRRRRPDCTLAIVGRTPSPEIVELARRDPKIQVTGTVPDIRPYLWGAAASLVPLRLGGVCPVLKSSEVGASRRALFSCPVHVGVVDQR